MSTKRRRFGTFVVVALATSLPARAFAQPPPPAGATPAPASSGAATPAADDPKMTEARARYERGKQLFDEKNFEAARTEFARAFDLAPSYRILYNIGVCDAQLNDYVAAIKHLESYLKEGGANVPDERRTEVERVLADLRPKIAHVSIKVEAGAMVAIDDVQIGVAPLPGSVDVNPGRRKISATKQGRFPATRSVIVAGSETVEVAITLDAPAPAGPAAPTTNYLPYVLWGGTAVLIGGAIFTGVSALNASKDLENMANTTPVQSSALEDQRSKMRTFGVAADLLTGAAVVCGGAAVYFTFFRPKATSTVQVGVLPGGVSVKGTF